MSSGDLKRRIRLERRVIQPPTSRKGRNAGRRQGQPAQRQERGSQAAEQHAVPRPTTPAAAAGQPAGQCSDSTSQGARARATAGRPSSSASAWPPAKPNCLPDLDTPWCRGRQIQRPNASWVNQQYQRLPLIARPSAASRAPCPALSRTQGC